MALTGLFLCSFLLIHLLGNVALFTDPVQFNEYTRFMSSNPIIRVMEIILVLGFLTHIVDAVMLSKANKAAQPVKYAMDRKQSSWYSRNMGLTGSIILAFLILHLQSFWYGYKFGDVTKIYNPWSILNFIVSKNEDLLLNMSILVAPSIINEDDIKK